MDSRQILATVARRATSRGLHVLLVGSQQHIIRVVAKWSDPLSTARVSFFNDILARVISAAPSSDGCHRVGKIIATWTDKELLKVHLETLGTSKYRTIFLFITECVPVMGFSVAIAAFGDDAAIELFLR